MAFLDIMNNVGSSVPQAFQDDVDEEVSFLLADPAGLISFLGMEIEDLLADPASGWISRRWHRCGLHRQRTPGGHEAAKPRSLARVLLGTNSWLLETS